MSAAGVLAWEGRDELGAAQPAQPAPAGRGARARPVVLVARGDDAPTVAGQRVARRLFAPQRQLVDAHPTEGTHTSSIGPYINNRTPSDTDTSCGSNRH